MKRGFRVALGGNRYLGSRASRQRARKEGEDSLPPRLSTQLLALSSIGLFFRSFAQPIPVNIFL
jgi:hypothetical protein